jgi:hypothetical protein
MKEVRPIRRARLAAASFAVAIGLLGALAVPAPAVGAFLNYGHCVSKFGLDPSDRPVDGGPWNSSADDHTRRLQEAGVLPNTPGAPLAISRSDGHTPFPYGSACGPTPPAP